MLMDYTKYSHKDLVGERFGWWTVVGREPPGSSHQGVVYLCKCRCGVERPVTASLLRKGSASCGCRRKVRADLTGKRFGHLVVIGKTNAPESYRTRGQQYWLCKCDCGNTLIATTGNLNFYPRNQRGGCRACSPKRNQYRLGRHKATPEYTLWEKARLRARRKGVPFDIAPEDVIIPETCPLLGIKLEHQKGAWGGSTPSLDRKVPSMGYVRGNTWVVSFRANLLKNNASRKELETLVERMKEHGIE